MYLQMKQATDTFYASAVVCFFIPTEAFGKYVKWRLVSVSLNVVQSIDFTYNEALKIVVTETK